MAISSDFDTEITMMPSEVYANAISTVHDDSCTRNCSCNTSNFNNAEEKLELNPRGKLPTATYYNLLKFHRQFRLYILSYIITHIGEWFSYIASIALVEELLGQRSSVDDGIQNENGPQSQSQSSSRTTISILVVVRLLPNVLLSPLGGLLADAGDRRHSMIALDVLGAITPLLFFLAMQFQSIHIIYVVTFLQQCIAGMYEPCRSSMIPMMITDQEYLKKATTLSGLCWSVFAAVGSTLGGFALTALGFQACFLLDSCTYLISAYLIWFMGGTWNPTHDDIDHSNDDEVDEVGIRLVDNNTTTTTIHCNSNSNSNSTTTAIIKTYRQFKGMIVDGFYYLRHSFWGSLILLKATGGIIYGAADVLNVSYSEPTGIPDNQSPSRLGILFACVGVGCFLGPLIADPFTDMKRPASLQKTCIVSIFLTAMGCLGMAAVADPASQFVFIGICTVVRSLGSSTNWIYSSLLLQTFATDAMMGRVTAVEYALALLTEAFSAYMAGVLQDQWHWSVGNIAMIMAATGIFLTLVWTIYHWLGRGAAASVAAVTSSATTVSISNMDSMVSSTGAIEKSSEMTELIGATLLDETEEETTTEEDDDEEDIEMLPR